MAFVTDTLARAAFKKMQGLAHTAGTKDLANESESSGIQVAANEVYVDGIASSPVQAVSDGVAAFVSLDLSLDPSSNGKAYTATIATVTGTGLEGKTNPKTGTIFQNGDRVGDIIPPKYGDSYRAILYSSSVEVPPLSSEDWFIDYKSGIITSEDNLALSGGTLDGYVYVGKYLSDVNLDGLNLGELNPILDGYLKLDTSNGPLTNNLEIHTNSKQRVSFGTQTFFGEPAGSFYASSDDGNQYAWVWSQDGNAPNAYSGFEATGPGDNVIGNWVASEYVYTGGYVGGYGGNSQYAIEAYEESSSLYLQSGGINQILLNSDSAGDTLYFYRGGSASRPSIISETGSANTGPYWPGTDQFAISVNGSQKQLWSSSASTLATPLLPAVNDGYSLGDSSFRWKDGYINNVYATEIYGYTTDAEFSGHTGNSSIHFTAASLNLGQYMTQGQLDVILDGYGPGDGLDLGELNPILDGYATDGELSSHTGDGTIHFTAASLNLGQYIDVAELAAVADGYANRNLSNLNAITLNAASGNETAWSLNYTTNKAAGEDKGLIITRTDTASPTTSTLFGVLSGSTEYFMVKQHATGGGPRVEIRAINSSIYPGFTVGTAGTSYFDVYNGGTTPVRFTGRIGANDAVAANLARFVNSNSGTTGIGFPVANQTSIVISGLDKTIWSSSSQTSSLDILPSHDDGYSIGSSSLRWGDGYFTNIFTDTLLAKSDGYGYLGPVTINLYVSTTGSDTNPGTFASPYRQPQRAIDYINAVKFAPGSTCNIYCGAGTFEVPDTSLVSHNISVCIYGSLENPIIDGYSTAPTPSLEDGYAALWTIITNGYAGSVGVGTHWVYNSTFNTAATVYISDTPEVRIVSDGYVIGPVHITKPDFSLYELETVFTSGPSVRKVVGSTQTLYTRTSDMSTNQNIAFYGIYFDLDDATQDALSVDRYLFEFNGVTLRGCAISHNSPEQTSFISLRNCFANITADFAGSSRLLISDGSNVSGIFYAPVELDASKIQSGIFFSALTLISGKSYIGYNNSYGLDFRGTSGNAITYYTGDVLQSSNSTVSGFANYLGYGSLSQSHSFSFAIVSGRTVVGSITNGFSILDAQLTGIEAACDGNLTCSGTAVELSGGSVTSTFAGLPVSDVGETVPYFGRAS